MIVMFDCSEIDTEVSDTGMEAIESDDCREVPEASRDTNNMLAII